MIVHEFKPLGVIGIVGMWLAVSFVLSKWGIKRSMTISQHVGAHKLGYGLYAVASTVFLSLFFCFITLWFSPHFKLPTIATVIVALGTVVLLVASWIPDRMRKDWMTYTHRICAYTMAATLFVFTAFIVASPRIHGTAKLISWLDLIILLVLGLMFGVSKRARAAYLYYQIIYLASFHAAILSATYIK